ncbi:MAG: nucleotide sugar dehydrogenase [Bacteroides sp.]|nr:nucleotide sugar dehydrogenase [Ruminococcus flavefaciens]MCM1554350.1 nucleotide sugar dehydrogenase [Bacteroides sp.]
MEVSEFLEKRKKIAVVGLGYVGLPLALALAKKTSVIGFDINAGHLEMLREGKDVSGELPAEAFKDTDIVYTDDALDLERASFYIVAVPTPIDTFNNPDLIPLFKATRTVGKCLKKGDCVVYESTVYPGATEEECVPLLEKFSGLECGKDFKIGYSPERINPGDRVHTLVSTRKIVSGCDDEALKLIGGVYALVVEAGLHYAPCIKVAESAKIVENIQRDVNIALMNELSIIFGRMGINTYDVLDAAGTKWNFLPFSPGLVGGHCIGVDPYYLVYKARELQYHSHVIKAGRFVNDSMGGYVGKRVIKKLTSMQKNVQNGRVLVLGITFKEDVADIRNSKVADVIRELKDYGMRVDVVDPRADANAVRQMYGFGLCPEPEEKAYEAVVVAVSHREYAHLTESDFARWLKDTDGLVADVKGLYRGKISRLNYWSL